MNPAPIDRLLPRLRGVKETANGWDAHCPAHDDHNPSLGIAVADDGTVLLKCRSHGCSADSICKAIGLKLTDLFPTRQVNGTASNNKKIVAAYDYVDAGGELLFQVVRFDPKDFRQRRPDPNGKEGWAWNLEGVPRVLYRLPEVLQAVAEGRPVYVVEGEKDADNLCRLGVTATTNAGGAGKWKNVYSETLRGASVVILPDNDAAGRNHALQVARSLYGVAASVRVVHLPDLPPKGDVSDWLAAGGTREQLEKLAAAAPETEHQDDGKACQEEGQDNGRKESQAMILTRHAAAAVLFHDVERRAYATVPVGDHHETLPIQSRAFKHLLVRAHYQEMGKPPSAKSLNDVLALIEARAVYDGPELPVHVRIAEMAGRIYLDLCNPQWEIVKITPAGWSILPSDKSPVRFLRPRGLLALHRPTRGGQLDDLRSLLGLRDDRQWCLWVGWVVMAFRPRGPYPVLGFHGEQGSGKSTAARITRSLIDPHSVPLRSEPKEPRDLMIAAKNSWCIALDNISHLSVWLSDALCRLATGGGFGTRELYTNDEEQLFDSMRPVILTGIEAVATRPDLLDRSVLLELASISQEGRKSEEELYAAVEPILPGILGALLDAVACALKNMPTVKLPALPRMADFAKWVTAAEPALGWKPGTFLAAYNASQEETNQVALDAYPIVEPLRQLIARQARWEGTSSELLAKLGELAGDKATKAEDWPKRANVLSGQLKRLAPNLRKIGLNVTFGSAGRGKAKSRRITIEADRAGDSSSPSSPSSPSPEKQGSGDDPCPSGDDPCPSGDDPFPASEALKNAPGDGGDAGDDLSPASESRTDREILEI
jgi:hypothetical protein